MKAFTILEDGTVFTGQSIGAQPEVISEIVFNTSMTGYLEVLTDPSYAGQAVFMTYPLIGNYGICYEDKESEDRGQMHLLSVNYPASQATSVRKTPFRTSYKNMTFPELPASTQEHSQRFSVKRVP